jgi:hypothetical protein
MSTPPGHGPEPGLGHAGEDTDAGPARLPRVIKRYANRKLYDTTADGFTSLARIRTLVRDGLEVVVLDHGTGADRTVEVLSRTLSRRGRIGVGIEHDQPDVALLAELIRGPERAADVINPDDYDPVDLQRLRDEVAALADILDQLITAAEQPDTDTTDDVAHP